MYYQEKYLKYKKKYLELKKMKGGDVEVKCIDDGKIYEIENCDPKIFENFSIFQAELASKLNYILSIENDEENNKVKVNLKSKNSAPTLVIRLLSKFYQEILANIDTKIKIHTDKTISLAPPIALPSLALPIALPSLAPTRTFCNPWIETYKRLYVSLVIDPVSEIGRFIYNIRDRMCREGITEDKCYDGKTTLYQYINEDGQYQTMQYLTDPHITLFTLYIRNDSYLDDLVNDEDNFGYLSNIINFFCKSWINKNAKKLKSTKDSFASFGGFKVRKYSDDETTLNEMLYKLIQNISAFLYYHITNKILDKKQIIKNIQPVNDCVNKTSTSFIHIVEKIPDTVISRSDDDSIRTSLFAFSSYTSGFKPHISIFKNSELLPPNTEDTVMNIIKDYITEDEEYLNLWTNDKLVDDEHGHISHTYISCDNYFHYY